MNKPVFSIIMPTYNSGQTIGYSLESIANQDIDKSLFECLVIDGGSTDSTRGIASQYDFVRILDNPKKLPEYAKSIGFQSAIGKYIIELDSDEAFSSSTALSDRFEAFSQNPNVHILIADKLLPCGGDFANSYVNYCGDPFTFFVYRQIGGIIKTYEKYRINYHNNCYIIDLSSCTNRPIADGGSKTIDIDFVKDNYENNFDISFVSSVSDRIMDISDRCLCIEDDNIIHRSQATLKKYLSKIRFRIINNIFKPDESGFSNRGISGKGTKYLFPFYVLSFILPLFDSFYLALFYKDIKMLMHIFYSYYTLFYIALYYLLKTFGINKSNKEY